MEDNTTTEMFLKLMQELHANTSALKDMLAQHEARITVLERSGEESKKDDWKTQLLMLLGKAILIGGVTIGTLTGASGLIAKVLNVQVAQQSQI